MYASKRLDPRTAIDFFVPIGFEVKDRLPRILRIGRPFHLYFPSTWEPESWCEKTRPLFASWFTIEVLPLVILGIGRHQWRHPKRVTSHSFVTVTTRPDSEESRYQYPDEYWRAIRLRKTILGNLWETRHEILIEPLEYSEFA